MTHTTIETASGTPIKTWLPQDEIEPMALEQLHNAANHPVVEHHVAAMPDCHVGFGVTIGSVVPTVNAVIPNAVGVDIGCGMCAVNTGIGYRDLEDRSLWEEWAKLVAKRVPTGFSWHQDPLPLGHLDRELRAAHLQPLVYDRAAKQLGTLGGGNHFMEAQRDEEGSIWLMVHSGSRNTGLRIANHYHTLAQQFTETYNTGVTKDLDYLRLDDETGQDYLHDMQWATDFALENRYLMLNHMEEALWDLLDKYTPTDTPINVHHNFANIETIDGQEAMVHRKGATSAYAGQLGIIPGSMGSNSYIVRGRGVEDSIMSCSHGAGRRMGRRAAKRTITEDAFREALEGTYSKALMSYADEAPMAYKDIEEVISRQLDLIDIVHTLRPIITVKGDSRAKED